MVPVDIDRCLVHICIYQAHRAYLLAGGSSRFRILLLGEGGLAIIFLVGYESSLVKSNLRGE